MQPSARSPKLRIYESLFLLNQGVDHVVALLRGMEKFPFADKESVQSAVAEIEEVRCDMNADFVEHLADSERYDEGRFWKQRRTYEKKWRDPDDVYLSVMARITAKERREIERRSKQREERLRRKYPEVHGKVVDFITHTIDDGTLHFTVRFNDQTSFCLRYACDMFAIGADLSDWQSGDFHVLREYMKPIPR